MKILRPWIGVLTCLAFWIGVRADTGTYHPTADKSQVVPEIVVTASKVPLLRTNTTQAITVLDERDIATTFEGNGNLAELLTFQPGAALTVLSRNDANWGSYGGLGPKYSTYMLDGLPMDAFVDTQALDPWAIKRVEVQRGPAAVLYPNYLSQDFAGNQSPLAGTVNVLTHDDVVEPLTRLDGAYGSYHTYRLRGYHEDLVGALSFFGGASYEKSDYTDYGSKDSWLHMLEDTPPRWVRTIPCRPNLAIVGTTARGKKIIIQMAAT
ncbi:MAG: TonB-dependent receptor plug domain-containing protein [Kiritimatiellaeota bacterium]|nr:TonB-dependent receptor plug domain-containing protein [Kiritimatiellota bacterium]